MQAVAKKATPKQATRDNSPEGVSFVVPVYNKAPYLPGVLDAIKAQRGDFARQYIFIDDGSSDGSLALLKRLTRGWPDTLIESQPNRGSANATNRGIALAEFEFIKFVDADDLLAFDATEWLLRALEGSDACLGRSMRIRRLRSPSETRFSSTTLGVSIWLHPCLRRPAWNALQTRYRWR